MAVIWGWIASSLSLYYRIDETILNYFLKHKAILGDIRRGCGALFDEFFAFQEFNRFLLHEKNEKLGWTYAWMEPCQIVRLLVLLN